MTITTEAARSILTGAGGNKRIDPNAEVPVTSWYLENQQPGHNKFYLCLVSDAGHCVLVWGRIGSAGQSKVEKYPTYGDAETIALKQAYAKAAKGYDMRDERFKFAVKSRMLDSAVDSPGNDRHADLMAARRMAKQDPQFTGEQQSATRHYDTFIGAAEKLMQRAARNEDAFALLEEWQALQDAWTELDAKHSTAATTLSLTGQMLQQKLFAS